MGKVDDMKHAVADAVGLLSGLKGMPDVQWATRAFMTLVSIEALAPEHVRAGAIAALRGCTFFPSPKEFVAHCMDARAEMRTKELSQWVVREDCNGAFVALPASEADSLLPVGSSAAAALEGRTERRSLAEAIDQMSTMRYRQALPQRSLPEDEDPVERLERMKRELQS